MFSVFKQLDLIVHVHKSDSSSNSKDKIKTRKSYFHVVNASLIKTKLSSSESNHKSDRFHITMLWHIVVVKKVGEILSSNKFSKAVKWL